MVLHPISNKLQLRSYQKQQLQIYKQAKNTTAIPIQYSPFHQAHSNQVGSSFNIQNAHKQTYQFLSKIINLTKCFNKKKYYRPKASSWIGDRLSFMDYGKIGKSCLDQRNQVYNYFRILKNTTKIKCKINYEETGMQIDHQRYNIQAVRLVNFKKQYDVKVALYKLKLSLMKKHLHNYQLNMCIDHNYCNWGSWLISQCRHRQEGNPRKQYKRSVQQKEKKRDR